MNRCGNPACLHPHMQSSTPGASSASESLWNPATLCPAPSMCKPLPCSPAFHFSISHVHSGCSSGVNGFKLVKESMPQAAAKHPLNAVYCTWKVPPPPRALKVPTIGSSPPFDLTSYGSCSRQAGLSVLQTHFVFGFFYYLENFLKVLAWLVVQHSCLTFNVISSLADQSKLTSHSLSYRTALFSSENLPLFPSFWPISIYFHAYSLSQGLKNDCESNPYCLFL